MKAWWGRRSPFARGLVAACMFSVISSVVTIAFFPGVLGWPWPPRILLALGLGIFGAMVAEHVRNVAQADLELAAMRDAIERLERGG